MNDITELAQSLKAAAEKATQGNWRAFKYHDGRCGIGGGHHDEIMVCEHISKRRPHDAEFIAMANPANILALVEALEKAQAGEKQWREVVDAFCADDADWHKLTNSNNELIALLSQALCKQADRIAELESRTVTDWIEHDGKWRPESLGLDELVYIKTRKQELKIPYPAGKVKGWMNTGGDMDVMAYKLASPQASTVTVKLPKPHAHLIWIQAGHAPDDYWDDVAVSHSEKDRCCDGSERYPVYARWEIEEMLAAAGIKVEAE